MSCHTAKENASVVDSSVTDWKHDMGNSDELESSSYKGNSEGYARNENASHMERNQLVRKTDRLYNTRSTTVSKDNTPQLQSMNTVLLKDMVPAARNNINTKFILLDKSRIRMEGQSKMCMALVADETAAVHFQLWGEECEGFEAGDIIRLENGIFSNSRNNKMVLRAGKRGCTKKIGEFTMVFVETPNMSEIQWAVDPNNSNQYVQQAILSPHSRVFPPLP